MSIQGKFALLDQPNTNGYQLTIIISLALICVLFTEPEEAINSFKMALRQNPSDSLLASKLGRAYVKTHQYNKAITYYREATINNINPTLKLDLAELYLKLKQYSNAEQTLIEDIESRERSVKIGKFEEDWIVFKGN